MAKSASKQRSPKRRLSWRVRKLRNLKMPASRKAPCSFAQHARIAAIYAPLVALLPARHGVCTRRWTNDGADFSGRAATRNRRVGGCGSPHTVARAIDISETLRRQNSMKLRHQRSMFAVVGCVATLALFAGCSDDDVLTPSGSAGLSGSAGSSGSAGASGSSNTAGKGGAPSAGAPSAGANTQGGAPSGGAPSGGAPSGGAPSGGAPSGGATSGSGGAIVVAGAGGEAGEPAGGEGGASEAGAGGEAGGGAFPISIPLLNPSFDTGDDNSPGTVKDWQTSGDLASFIGHPENAAHTGPGRLAMWRATPAYKVSTFQTVNGLTNGTYTLSAWVDGASSGLNSVYIYAQGYGSVPTDQVKKDITPTTTYAQFSLTDIQVTSGTLTVGVYVDGAADAWANVDDVTLVRVQ
jgi:hypothetical protein